VFSNDLILGHGTAFDIVITYDSATSIDPPATLIKTVLFGDGFSINEYQTDSSTLYGHANAAGAESVGAAFFLDTPEWGMSPPILESFSSAGGTPILFGPMGTPLTVPEVRLKPEIVAVDGVNTSFFYEDEVGDMNPDFFGTSAAAAHAAGVAALMLEAKPTATPVEIKAALHSTAIDMGTAGFDHDSGNGLIQADSAIAALVMDTDGDGVSDVADNCTLVPNGPDDTVTAGPSQNNTDGDIYGNMCDADLDNSGFVNFGDLAAFKAVFGTPDPNADFNGSGFVNFGDLARFKALFGQPPGPSGVSP
jgi:subtilisin family serine protease